MEEITDDANNICKIGRKVVYREETERGKGGTILGNSYCIEHKKGQAAFFTPISAQKVDYPLSFTPFLIEKRADPPNSRHIIIKPHSVKVGTSVDG
jgi:hypothetical protein